jgi:hypothetical protein
MTAMELHKKISPTWHRAGKRYGILNTTVAWSLPDDLDLLCVQLLWNGGLDVNIYEIEHAKLLVGLQKGIQVDDLHRFLLEQPEVHEFEWNGQTFSASSSRNEKHRRLHDKTSKQQHKKNSKSKSRVHKGDSKSKGAKKQVSATTNEKSEL